MLYHTHIHYIFT
jgi:hypothetical protein